jgi:hypothetical protein
VLPKSMPMMTRSRRGCTVFMRSPAPRVLQCRCITFHLSIAALLETNEIASQLSSAFWSMTISLKHIDISSDEVLPWCFVLWMPASCPKLRARHVARHHEVGTLHTVCRGFFRPSAPSLLPRDNQLLRGASLERPSINAWGKVAIWTA